MHTVANFSVIFIFIFIWQSLILLIDGFQSSSLNSNNMLLFNCSCVLKGFVLALLAGRCVVVQSLLHSGLELFRSGSAARNQLSSVRGYDSIIYRKNTFLYFY